MKSSYLFLACLIFIASCIEKNEFASVLETDPLTKNGEIFIDESGEEYWMGCENSWGRRLG